jgi:hypothetical protein
MNMYEKRAVCAHDTSWNAQEKRREMEGAYRRSCVFAAFLSAVAIGLAACSGSGTPKAVSSPAVASLRTSNSGESSTTAGGGNSETSSQSRNATEPLNEWTDCMRNHGDPNQADPIVDTYGVINIHIPADAQSLSGQVHGGDGPCNSYLAAAANALRVAHPVAAPPTSIALVKYAACMRDNGVPNFPDPNPVTGETNLNGTGVDLNSPIVENANEVCGKQIGAPAWWISGTGPPGDIVVTSGPGNGPPPGGPSSDG